MSGRLCFLLAFLPAVATATDPYGTASKDNRNMHLTASVGVTGGISENKKVSGTNVEATFSGAVYLDNSYSGSSPAWDHAYIYKIDGKITGTRDTGTVTTTWQSWNISPPTESPGGGELPLVHEATKTIRFASTYLDYNSTITLDVKVYYKCWLPNNNGTADETDDLTSTGNLKQYNRSLSFKTTVTYGAGQNPYNFPDPAALSADEATEGKNGFVAAKHDNIDSDLEVTKTNITDALPILTGFSSHAHATADHYFDSASNNNTQSYHLLTWSESKGYAFPGGGRTVPPPNYVAFWICSVFSNAYTAADAFGIHEYNGSDPTTWDKFFLGFEAEVLRVLVPNNRGTIDIYDLGVSHTSPRLLPPMGI